MPTLNDCSVSKSWRSKLLALGYEFRQMPQVECPVEHLFENGNYIREMRIPAGALFIGRIHRHGHEVQLISGRLIHRTPQGYFELEGPLGVRTQPGDQMVAYMLTDVVARSIHPCGEERDVETLANEWFEPIDVMDKLAAQIHEELTWQASGQQSG
jgi:hypothetical protein